MTTDTQTPNTDISAASAENSIPSLDSIAAKMTAMRNQTQRNLLATTSEDRTGDSPEGEQESPVAPESDSDVEPEIATAELPDSTATEEDLAQEQEPVSEDDTASDTSDQEIIDFIEFAETNPNAKFRFTRNGQEMVIDARKAAAILGQGGAIHEEARKLKIERSEFDEYMREQRARQEGLALAVEFTVEPRLQKAYDEIVKTQGYQTQFNQQLAQIQDPGQRARIQASMQQNERYIQQQQAVIQQLKPRVDEFRSVRQQQVREVLENNRKNFQDRELKNEYVYNELRETISKNWSDARGQLVPGVDNIDLISADEYILGLLRDGLKFRDRPRSKSSGASIAQLQNRKGSAPARNQDQDLQQLRDRARNGDKKAADNLLVAQLNKLRAARSR